MLELTQTVEDRKMREQVLDSMDLERERGITIKMTPVRMDYAISRDIKCEADGLEIKKGEKFVLNLIDTPGHIDFSYEVSRSLRAVEGAVLLIDATQGVQAQTMTVLEMAKDANLKILPVLNKIDSPLANIEDTKSEIIKLLNCKDEDILAVSGKTGEGVIGLLDTICEKFAPPSSKDDNKKNSQRALIFDFEYSNHQGVILYIRQLNGKIKKGDEIIFKQSRERFIVREVGYLKPQKVESKEILEGEIGYVVTGIKEPGVARVGDTITLFNNEMESFPGYSVPTPLVFASIYPEAQEYFDDLRTALKRLQLSDSSLTFEEEQSGALGRGFRCGFLGMLHMEIVTERLRREHNLELVITSPSITYEVTKNKRKGFARSTVFICAFYYLADWFLLLNWQRLIIIRHDDSPCFDIEA
jgi:GTP-binding protein LepA